MNLLNDFSEEFREELDDIADFDPAANSFQGLVIAFNILAKYYPKKMDEKYFWAAEHDIIYFYEPDTDRKFDPYDAERLYRLGFHVSSDTGWWAMFT